MTVTATPERLVVGIDVLQRALDYTCAALMTIGCDDVDRPTPCTGWTLADLLAHMEDALDAFAEAADGRVALRSAAPSAIDQRVRVIRRKATALLGAWLAADAGRVGIGGDDGPSLPVDAVARIAALEIAVHGWDVGRTTGRGDPLPEPLAEAVLATAREAALSPAVAGAFAPPLPVPITAPASRQVLAFVGRADGPADG